jgi:PhnB protein
MTAPTVYLMLPGNARAALDFYAGVFGGEAQLHTYADFRRTDGPADAVAHGALTGGPVALFAADVTGDEPAFRSEGMLLSLLGTAPPATLHAWFSRLADGGEVLRDLAEQSWGAADGEVVDRFGVRWLVGFEGSEEG